MNSSGLDLRSLVAEAVRDAVRELEQAGTARRAGGSPHDSDVGPTRDPARATAGSEHITAPALRTRVESVRIADDGDLDAFARRLLALLENPKNRYDLRAGRLRFRLDSVSRSDGRSAPAAVFESGAVTERDVLAAHRAGKRIVVGAKAVMTPLGREKARALGLPIEREC